MSDPLEKKIKRELLGYNLLLSLRGIKNPKRPTSIEIEAIHERLNHIPGRRLSREPPKK